MARESFFVRFLSSRLAVGAAVAFVVLLLLAAIFELIEWWLFAIVVLIALVGFLAYGLGRDYLGRRKDDSFEAGMDDQARQQAQQEREQSTAVAQMHARWQEGFRKLREKLKGRGAIYDLPWFVIIGKPGTGKTSAIRHSGLDFPLEFDSDRGTKGVGGTRNCDWFFAEQAILLDTAGRWSEGDTKSSDRREWIEFLGLLRKYRTEMPINGLLIAVAADDLLRPDARVAEDARRMRERLDELLLELKIQFPVFLLITKCDLVTGFSDVFGRLPKVQNQLLGWTNPGWEMQGFQPQIDEAMKGLCERVRELRPALLRDEEDAVATRNIFTFPDHLRRLTDAVQQYVDALFRETRYNESAFLRGIYFTSALQTGDSIADVIRRMGVEYKDPLPSSKSYFLEEFFTERLVEDGRLVVPTGAATRRLRAAKFGGVAAVALVSLVFAAFATGSYLRNRVLLNRISAEIAEVDELPRLAPAQQGERLAAYWDDLTILKERAKHPNWLERMGLFKGRVALPKVERAFMSSYQAAAHTPTLGHVQTALHPGDDPAHGVAAVLAMVDYLVTTRQARQKELEGGGERLAAFWSSDSTPQGQVNFANAFRFYVRDPWRADDADSQTRRAALDAERQAQLAALQAALPELLTVSTMEAWLRAEPAALTLPEGLSSDSPPVPGAFSPRAWNERIKPLVEAVNSVQSELGDYTTDSFVRAYATAYYEQWLNQLLSLQGGGASCDELRKTAAAYLAAFEKIQPLVKDPIAGGAPAWTAMLAPAVAKKAEYAAAMIQTCDKAKLGDPCAPWKVPGPDPFLAGTSEIVAATCQAAESDDGAQRAQAEVLSTRCAEMLGRPPKAASAASRQRCGTQMAGAAPAGGGGGGDPRAACPEIRQKCQEFAAFVDCQLGVPKAGAPIPPPGWLTAALRNCRTFEEVLGTPEAPKVHAVRVTSLLGENAATGLAVVETRFRVLCGERDFGLKHRNTLVEDTLRWSTACDRSEIELTLASPDGVVRDEPARVGRDGPCSLYKLLGDARRHGDEYVWTFPQGASTGFRVVVPDRLATVLPLFCGKVE